jgi:hypothetical protein
MAVEKTRKTDRRTLYTRMVIKDSLLALLRDSSFRQTDRHSRLQTGGGHTRHLLSALR